MKELRRPVNNIVRWDNYKRFAEQMDGDLKTMFTDKEKGAELKKAYDIFRDIQKQYIQKVICEGKKDDKLVQIMNAAEQRCTDIYKDIALRMLMDQAEEFEEKIEDTEEPKDFMLIMNQVVKKNWTTTAGTLAGEGFWKYSKIASGLRPDNDDDEIDETLDQLTEKEQKELEQLQKGK